ncbi:MAG: DEAD/DEAH box helicase [Anaerovibrio sp.]
MDDDDIDALIPDMEKIADVPSRSFITMYREEIEDFILEKYPGLVRKLYCKYFHVDKKTEIFFPALAGELRQRVLGENLLAVYQGVLYKIGFNDNISMYDFSPWKNRMAIDLGQVIYNEVPLYDFQEEAVKKLQQFAASKEKRAGILVMPTGSGKTRTAVYFLLQDMISNGYQVIWLAHRHMLLEQAADAFFNLHPIIKNAIQPWNVFLCCVYQVSIAVFARQSRMTTFCWLACNQASEMLIIWNRLCLIK